MKTLMIALLVCLASSPFARAQADERPLADAIKDWRTVRISLVLDGGDYTPPAPFILLQRLDSERIVLSNSENDLRAESLPVVRAIVTTETAQTLIESALAFYAQAQKETGEKARVAALPPAERDAIYKKAGFGISAAYIRIEVLGANRSYQYHDDFADGSAALNQFGEFIMRQKVQSK